MLNSFIISLQSKDTNILVTGSYLKIVY